MRYADSRCNCEEKFNPHRYVYTGKCIQTGESVTVEIPAAELFAYRRGEYIQTAMPSVSVDDREFLMSGFSAKGWQEAFGFDEENDEELLDS